MIVAVDDDIDELQDDPTIPNDVHETVEVMIGQHNVVRSQL